MEAKYTAAIMICLVVAASLMLYAVPEILQWMSLYPVLIAGFLTLVLLLVVAIKKDEGKYLKLGLIIVLGAMIWDWMIPPYSLCAIAPTGTEQIAIQQAGLSGLAEDTFLCKIVSSVYNFDIFKFTLNGNFLPLILPALFIAFFSLLILAVKIDKKYWTSVLYALALIFVVVFVSSGEHYTGQYAITFVFLVTYVLTPIVLFIIMSILMKNYSDN